MITEQRPPETKPVASQCKKCRRDMVIYVAVDCSQDWLAKLLPMATCSPCFDRHNRCRNSIEKMERCCGLLCRASLVKPESEKAREVIAKSRETIYATLTRCCYELLAAWCEEIGKTWAQPVDQLVDQIMEKPSKLSIILHHAKKEIPRLASVS